MKRILFIGNSFTQRNDLPGMIEKLAAAGGVQVETQLISAGGASLKRHWNAGEARRAIENGKLDWVVLQEQSTLPIKNVERFHQNVRLFDDVVRKSGAKMALYMTWARAHAPESQRALTDSYNAIGKELRATVVPVGEAWRKFLAKHDEPILHDKDGSHPTFAGTYLAACVFVRTLFDVDPNGAKAGMDQLTREQMKLLERAGGRA